jgi:hypothetical protein
VFRTKFIATGTFGVPAAPFLARRVNDGSWCLHFQVP